jgi:phosphosulfolactate synthase
MPVPRFLDLPERDVKPRTRGLTFAIDGGMTVTEMQDVLVAQGAWLDLWKLGWGSAYLDPAVGRKVALLREHEVLACPGGTLLEIAALQGRAAECIDWVLASGFACIEVSDGLALMAPATRTELIRRAACDVVVVAEVGSKRADVTPTPDDWVRVALDYLAAGASWVVAEGRESGTVGLYEPDGSVRTVLVDRLLDRVGPERVVFEAPRKDQQAWFVRHVGPDVHLANVSPRESLGVEALRLGLRADTTLAVHGAVSGTKV